MSTIKDFKNAPVGATATSSKGLIALKTGRGAFEWSLYDPRGRPCDNFSSDEMEHFTLNPAAPKNSREALDMAWELAYPVKEGQSIPKGTKYLERHNGVLREYIAFHDMNPKDGDGEWVRSQDPLPDHEPDWRDAPAVLATCGYCEMETEGPPVTLHGPLECGNHWECTECHTATSWRALGDVTPLWSKDDA